MKKQSNKKSVAKFDKKMKEQTNPKSNSPIDSSNNNEFKKTFKKTTSNYPNNILELFKRLGIE